MNKNNPNSRIRRIGCPAPQKSNKLTVEKCEDILIEDNTSECLDLMNESRSQSNSRNLYDSDREHSDEIDVETY